MNKYRSEWIGYACCCIGLLIDLSLFGWIWKQSLLSNKVLWFAPAGSVCIFLGLFSFSRSTAKKNKHLVAADMRLKQSETECNRLLEELHLQGRLENELLVAKQAAEAAVLAKGSFLATMSHEIRTPLNGIIPMLDMVARGQLAPDQREMLQTANDSSLQLLRILDDVLDFSKLEADKLTLETTTFNLRDLLERVTQLMQRAADAKRLTLHLHIDERVRLPVRGDPVRLRQILSNLIGNAIKFTERGRIDIYLRRLGNRNTKHYLRFEVHDTGIGITKEQESRLFSAFSQADASTTRLYGGTGLGLAICKHIVSLMEGQIGVQSQPGVGSTFWFEVALSKIPGDLYGVPGASDQPKVLLVSNNTHLLEHLCNRLEEHGILAESTQSTQQAIDQLERVQITPQHFHAVVGDFDSLLYSARALQRTVLKTGRQGVSPEMIWLQGEETIPEELLNDSQQIPRHSADEILVTNMSLANRPVSESAESPLAIQEEPQPVLPHLDARILLVEDNPVNLAVALKLLNSLGYQADTAPNGEVALESLEKDHYDLVFMDCQMPVLDGYAATRRWRIREHEQEVKRLPIVAMTANAMAGDRQRCLDAGMDEHIAKPIARNKLIECLQHWLANTAEKKESDPIAQKNADQPDNNAKRKSQGSNSLAVVDAKVIDELYEIAGNETISILELFLKDAPESIAGLQTAVAENDPDLMRESAHKLKSSSANVGAKALSSAAKLIETVVRQKNVISSEAMVGLVVSEFARVRFALRLQIERLRKQ